MYNDDREMHKLPCGVIVTMSADVYDNDFSSFTESQYFSFNNFINAGLYFPQIMQFIGLLFAILDGMTKGSHIVLYCILSGIFNTLLWRFLRLYRTPGLSFISCLVGGNVFRYNLHFLVLAYVSFFVVKDWKVLLFCVIGGIVSTMVRSLLHGFLLKVSYVNEVVRYVAGFKYKY